METKFGNEIEYWIQEYPEEIRLKYRFIDLRRNEMHENIKLRSKIF